MSANMMKKLSLNDTAAVVTSPEPNLLSLPIRVSPSVLRDYAEQGDLGVVFHCREGSIKCAKRALAVSDHFFDRIDWTAEHDEFYFDNQSTESVKIYLDFIHMLKVPRPELPLLLDVMKFLHCDARGTCQTYLKNFDPLSETGKPICENLFGNVDGGLTVDERAAFVEFIEDDTTKMSRRVMRMIKSNAVRLSEISFGCGDNSSRRLGVDGGDQKKPVKSDFGVVNFVNANWGATFTINPSGDLFINGNKITISEPVKYATSYRGSNYAIDVNGRLMSWGGNKYGQLGHSNFDQQTTPKVIEALENVRQVSVYNDRVACTTTDNAVYFWGDCGSKFGLDDKVTSPHKMDQRATHVEVGVGHAMLINNGEVLSRGWNEYGELGVGDYKDRTNWTKVNLPSGEQVRQIQCGAYCSAILTDRSVYVMGRYLVGGSSDKVNKPTRVELDNIVAISLKAYHILALDSKGAVFGWGQNDNGKCGANSDASQIEKPTRVAIPEHYAVTQISAGVNHSMFKCQSK